MMNKIFFRVFLILISITTSFLPLSFGVQEKIDGIIAIVNAEIITLTDLKICIAFSLYHQDMDVFSENDYEQTLEELINQRLIIQMTGKNAFVSQDEIEDSLREISELLGSDNLKKQLEHFNMELVDLNDFLEEKLLYEKIIFNKFGQSTSVKLMEIEDYYNQTYVLQQKSQGEEPLPMMEMLHTIEAAINREKSSLLEEEWVNNVRQEADIQKFTDNYPEFFKKF